MPRLDGRIAHLRLGIQIPPYAVNRRSQATTFRIVCPAALVPVKGHSVLLAALSQLKDSGIPVKCTLFGTGPLRAELENAVASRGLQEQVEFGGFIPQGRLHDLYRSGGFDAIVLASRDAGEKMMEGVPSALLEAMAFAIPIVATNSGSVREAIDGRCGLLVPPDDASALAATF
jgi:glycosyltransferase involved in cell wall biosynthesis